MLTPSEKIEELAVPIIARWRTELYEVFAMSGWLIAPVVLLKGLQWTKAIPHDLPWGGNFALYVGLCALFAGLARSMTKEAVSGDYAKELTSNGFNPRKLSITLSVVTTLFVFFVFLSMHLAFKLDATEWDLRLANGKLKMEQAGSSAK